MKKLEYSVFAIIAAFMLLTLNGCSEDEYTEDSLPPDLWRVYKDDIAITDTIGQRHPECSFEVPTEGGTYRIKCLVNCFVGYEIEDPKDWQGMLTVLADDRYINPLYYDITFTPNETKVPRQFTIHCYLLKSKAMSLKVIANQAPANP